MEFKFDPKIDYQIEAINSVIHVFKGQKNTYEDRPFIEENGIVPNLTHLSNDDILENLKQVQARNDIEDRTKKLDTTDFSIEMETGTGKTYVYLRTIMELFQKYGWQKYIIVVPSVAIREGVVKTLNQTKKHFKKLYGNINYNFFEYDSKNLQDIRSFSRNNNIEIMVITLHAFNKEEVNIMHRYRDILHGKKPADLIKQTNPILILDEPQNMESKKSKRALKEFNPLFTIRYSATHRKMYNLIYKLTPYDAYKKGLVKKIDVLSVVKERDFNTTFIEVNEVKADKDLKARLTLHKKLSNGIKKGKSTVRLNDNLYNKSKGVDKYRDIRIKNINVAEEFVEFSNGDKIYKGESTDTDIKEIQRLQIKETIKEHFDKALEYRPKGIKVLSLFFIDKVSHYTDKNGHIRIAFEKEFNKLKKKDKYKKLYNHKKPKNVMSSYFSEYTSDSRIRDDSKAYDLIMRNKEQLLNLEEPAEFIFSHSALKEGWDNPNVFNICTLNNTVSNVKKRQEIGRGVRLPVNQAGERIYDDNINILTVVANESYADYVAQLQTEYEEETGNKDDIRDRVKERSKRKTLEPRKDQKENPNFKKLWSKIAVKTRYKTKINTKKLVEEATKALNELDIREPQISIHKVSIETEANQVEMRHRFGRVKELKHTYAIPNLLNHFSKETYLTKKTLVTILRDSNTLQEIFKNPEEYIRTATNVIKRIKDRHVIQEIEYVKTNEKFTTAILDKLTTYTDKTTSVDKSIYSEIICDSKGEKKFAQKLDKDDEIPFFIKLPPDFKIPTPIGSYNPDWGIVFRRTNQSAKSKISRLYLVRETKFVDEISNIRPSERIKIDCAKKHFETINVDFAEITDVNQDLVDLLN